VWLGGSLGLALIGDDQWFFPVRLSLLGLVEPTPDSELANRSGMRFQAHLGVGYRAMLRGGDLPLYLVPEIGGALSWEQITDETTLFTTDLASCRSGTCAVRWDLVDTTNDLFRVMPTAGLTFGFGYGEIGYQFQIDPTEIERSVHQITVGAQF
jgi:hypothetical protein